MYSKKILPAGDQKILALKDIKDLLKSEHNSQKIDIINWDNYPYKPDVKFNIAHSRTEIYLQYLVNEKYIRAKYIHNNDPVWNDSCVEFFISPFPDGTYYNFEFNCIGALLIGFGNGRDNRERAGKEITSQIRCISSLGNQAIEPSEGNFIWDLTIVIPVSAFYKHQVKEVTGMKAKANFYKCGDELKEPHYLTWKPINYPKPNFHLPDFFGDLIFD
jgi:hypothetical protein